MSIISNKQWNLLLSKTKESEFSHFKYSVPKCLVYNILPKLNMVYGDYVASTYFYISTHILTDKTTSRTDLINRCFAKTTTIAKAIGYERKVVNKAIHILDDYDLIDIGWVKNHYRKNLYDKVKRVYNLKNKAISEKKTVYLFVKKVNKTLIENLTNSEKQYNKDFRLSANGDLTKITNYIEDMDNIFFADDRYAKLYSLPALYIVRSLLDEVNNIYRGSTLFFMNMIIKPAIIDGCIEDMTEKDRAFFCGTSQPTIHRYIKAYEENGIITSLNKEKHNEKTLLKIGKIEKGIKMYTCPVCNKSFKNEGSLNVHISKVNDKQHKFLNELKKLIISNNFNLVCNYVRLTFAYELLKPMFNKLYFEEYNESFLENAELENITYSSCIASFSDDAYESTKSKFNFDVDDLNKFESSLCISNVDVSAAENDLENEYLKIECKCTKDCLFCFKEWNEEYFQPCTEVRKNAFLNRFANKDLNKIVNLDSEKVDSLFTSFITVSKNEKIDNKVNTLDTLTNMPKSRGLVKIAKCLNIQEVEESVNVNNTVNEVVKEPVKELTKTEKLKQERELKAELKKQLREQLKAEKELEKQRIKEEKLKQRLLEKEQKEKARAEAKILKEAEKEARRKDPNSAVNLVKFFYKQINSFSPNLAKECGQVTNLLKLGATPDGIRTTMLFLKRKGNTDLRFLNNSIKEAMYERKLIEDTKTQGTEAYLVKKYYDGVKIPFNPSTLLKDVKKIKETMDGITYEQCEYIVDYMINTNCKVFNFITVKRNEALAKLSIENEKKLKENKSKYESKLIYGEVKANTDRELAHEIFMNNKFDTSFYHFDWACKVELDMTKEEYLYALSQKGEESIYEFFLNFYMDNKEENGKKLAEVKNYIKKYKDLYN